MNYTQWKGQQVFPGLTIEIEKREDRIFRVTVRSPDTELVIVRDEYYSSALSVLIPAPPKMTTKHRITGCVGGLEPIDQLFDSKDEAARECERLTGVLESSVWQGDDGLFKVEEVEIPEV